MLGATHHVLRFLAGAAILTVIALPTAVLAVASVVAETVRTFRLAFRESGTDAL